MLLSVAVFVYWPGFSVEAPALPQNTVTFENFGNQADAAINIVSIAPVVTPQDYASIEHFKAKMIAYFDAAQEQGWLNSNTIVLLPEHIGTPLLTIGHKSRVYNALSIENAFVPVIARNLPSFLKNYYIFEAEAPLLAATVRTQTANAARAYQLTFSSLAQQYGVTIAAGSILLMTPGLYPDGLSYGHGPIFNAGFVFGLDGKVQIDAIRQVALSKELSKVAKASLAEFIPAFTLNGIRYAVALGDDAFNEDVSAHLKEQNIDLLLSPKFYLASETAINTPFGTALHFPWSVSNSMSGSGWGLSLNGSAAFASTDDYTVSQTSKGNAIIQNVWVTK